MTTEFWRMGATPVPVTGQTLGVLLTGALYGPRRGTLAVLAYLGEGLAGAPALTGGGAPGRGRNDFFGGGGMGRVEQPARPAAFIR